MNLEGIGMTSRRTRERLVSRLLEKGIGNVSVLEVFLNTPRHLFVDEALAHKAYEDTALPIGHGQTISQPYIVARMTELLLSHGTPERVLEIGTGSGFQTAVLAQLVPEVWSVERIWPLQQKAQKLLSVLELTNIHLRFADGGFGWEDAAPYDGIITTCAPESVPDSLLQQLNPEGGRLVIPVGESEQSLYLIIRDGDNFQREKVEVVKFVPLLNGTINKDIGE